MNIERFPIESHPALDDHRTFMDISVNAQGRVAIGEANALGAVLPTADTSHDFGKLIAGCLTTQPQRDPKHETIAIMQTLDGEIIAEWECDLSGDYLAHLGFYNVNTDTLRLIEFVVVEEKE